MSPRARAHLARERNAEAEAEEDDGDGASGEGGREQEKEVARAAFPQLTRPARPSPDHATPTKYALRFLKSSP